MAAPLVMDPTKTPCGAITMAYQDHFFLDRWVRHYGAQFGRENLFVLSHGEDPEHRRIAAGANIIHVPRDPMLWRFDRRRWWLMTHFSAGMLRYFNWLIVGDVDEVVVVDPAVAPDLVSYLARHDNPRTAPKSICPLGIELVHNPEAEPEPIEAGVPVLSRRRVFRANANYSKPCIIRRDAGFTIGGHANDHQPRYLDPHLYLIHMRFFDHDRAVERLGGRKALREVITGDRPAEEGSAAWSKDLETYLRLSKGRAVREDVELADFRRKMVDGQQTLHDGKVVFFGGGRTKELYRLPERFAAVF